MVNGRCEWRCGSVDERLAAAATATLLATDSVSLWNKSILIKRESRVAEFLDFCLLERANLSPGTSGSN